jgi:translation initiation factor 2 subunit 2
MSEEPLFDPSLKKRKKKTVAFSEEASADPTQPAPTTIDSHTANGDKVDLGPTTLHEQMESMKLEDEFKGMKKKKKKVDVMLDLVSLAMGIWCVWCID